MFQKILITAGATMIMVATGAGSASAGGLITTPSERVGAPGQPCLFVGTSTVGNPLQPGPLFATDPRTGAYLSCPY